MRTFSFIGGSEGTWRVVRMAPVAGEGLPIAMRLEIVAGAASGPGAQWCLRGITSHERYVTHEEKRLLESRQPGLGRPHATHAALIPIRKSPAWWALAQDERRAVFEEQSRHVAIGLEYLPAVARRLHHCRDLGEAEPFDFLTWFEYGPGDAAAFEDLVERLRESPEWRYVEREVDIRLEK